MSYIELHCHSNFSLLDGASHPEELIIRAAELGMPALALTDHDAVYGAPRFIRAAREFGVKPILGAELTLSGPDNEPAHHLTLLAENEAGWHNLCYLISRGRHGTMGDEEAPQKGRAILLPEELLGCTNGLIALSGCRNGEISTALLKGDRDAALVATRRYRDLFGKDNFWIELQRHFLPGEEWLVSKLAALAEYLQLDCVATNNVHYASQDKHKLQDVLVSIGNLTTLDEAAQEASPQNGPQPRRLNSEYYLKSAEQMASLFQDNPQALAATNQLAERCHFELQYGLQDLPHFATPQGMSSAAYLRRLCEEALPSRYPGGVPDKVGSQLAHELNVIEGARLANYFLIVWDIVRFSRQQGIRCQGRGSAANSLVAYLLYISPIDPIIHDLVFERFISPERLAPNPAQGLKRSATSAPDIDIDFDAQRREEVIQYIYQTYGANHTAMACTFVTFRSRSAIRDIGKALDLPTDVVSTAANELMDVIESPLRKKGYGGSPGDRYAKKDWGSGTGDQKTSAKLQSLPENNSASKDKQNPKSKIPVHEAADQQHPKSKIQNPKSLIPLLLDLCSQIEGFPRHLGIHSGGMIITGPPLMGRVPTEPATMPDRVVVQWDKDGLEDAGLVKIDILGLRMLSAVTEAALIIEEITGEDPGLDNLSFDDPAVFEMIGRADTIGVFQVESRAQAQMLPRLKPTCFNDIVVGISLIRPGPIQGNMVHPFLRRRQGLEPVTYAHPLLEPALAETLGVILFQEQVLKVARDLAGFTAGQGELLRRALGSKRATEAIGRFYNTFISGAEANGVSSDVAEKVFEQLLAFGGYSFAKSHAAAFAVIVYQSAWLKQYHYIPFFCSLLNNQPMGFWVPAVLVSEAKREGIQILAVDIMRSREKCAPAQESEGGGIRLGFNYVKALREDVVERIMIERAKTPLATISDFYQRVRPGRQATENLIQAGAMDSWGLPRRQLLWELGTLYDSKDKLDLNFSPDNVELPSLTPAEAMLGEQSVLGLSTGDHIMTFYRAGLEERGILNSEQLTHRSNGQRVRAAGLAVVHQAPPTAKGFHFLTLEDETGMINVIVRPQVHSRYRRTIHQHRLLLVEGVVQQADGVTNLLADRVLVLPPH